MSVPIDPEVKSMDFGGFAIGPGHIIFNQRIGETIVHWLLKTIWPDNISSQDL